MFCREEMSGEENRTVSSANCKWDMMGPFLQAAIPAQRCFSVAFFIKRFKTSTTNTKRKGDKGSPWRRPLRSLKGFVGVPFNKIDAAAEEIHE